MSLKQHFAWMSWIQSPGRGGFATEDTLMNRREWKWSQVSWSSVLQTNPSLSQNRIYFSRLWLYTPFPSSVILPWSVLNKSYKPWLSDYPASTHMLSPLHAYCSPLFTWSFFKIQVFRLSFHEMRTMLYFHLAENIAKLFWVESRGA